MGEISARPEHKVESVTDMPEVLSELKLVLDSQSFFLLFDGVTVGLDNLPGQEGVPRLHPYFKKWPLSGFLQHSLKECL